jgi:hypothetical protein
MVSPVDPQVWIWGTILMGGVMLWRTPRGVRQVRQSDTSGRAVRAEMT